MGLVEKNKEEALKLAALLSDAVDKGMVAKADEYSRLILALSKRESRIELPESEWHNFLSAVRKTDPGFVSAYILTAKDIGAIVDSGFTENSDPLCVLLKEAKSKDAWVLELPLGGEEPEEAKNV
jgi:hypothetical protein